MGRHEKTKELSEPDFRRLTGVKPQAFEKMLEILKRAFAKKRARRPPQQAVHRGHAFDGLGASKGIKATLACRASALWLKTQ